MRNSTHLVPEKFDLNGRITRTLLATRSHGVSFANGRWYSIICASLVQFIVADAGANVPLIFYECDGLEQGRGIEIRAPL